MTLLLFVFGLAIFLFAMRNLERGIRLSGGEGLKRWIVNRTNTALSAAGVGVAVTAIMQSSSMVSLVVLAFVSAEILPLFNGIGVVLGANVGTTVTGWVVTIVGFKMDLQAMVVPMLGIGAALSLDYFKNDKVKGLGTALFAFGLLIFGLDIMKNSVAGVSEMFDIAEWRDLPAWVYLLIGVLLAAVMQSSSAVMIIALSMLNSDIVQLTDAAAVIIGADLGTTSTTILGSLGQSVVKKQLALAHVFFNLIVNSLAFIFLLPALPELLRFLSVTDPMFGLVTFHSTFNVLGLLVFLPILKFYARWIQRVLPTEKDLRAQFFSVPIEVPDAAIDSLESALTQLKSDAIRLNLKTLDLPLKGLDERHQLKPSSLVGSFDECYESLKLFEGDLIRYARKVQQAKLSSEQGDKAVAISETARALVYASKTLKDVRHDFAQLNTLAETPLGEALGTAHRQYLRDFYVDLIPLLFSAHDAPYVTESMGRLAEQNARHQQVADDIVAQQLQDEGRESMPLSTLFNLNHELHHYARYMLSSIGTYAGTTSK
ncbi:transporter [Arenicella chitinivorans]|uniref:Transporter n=1 Tax=Arenicella chitinivorans TaxID=1329800 RepID=A0A918RK11_9GAMM|nr:Na/Pi symporter [Arenicella chitinivorans]GGZ97904.1 transporter [Arenicella chitinivorans]